MLFQLTAPLREPTATHYIGSIMRLFQLTAPLREPTSRGFITIYEADWFQLTAPLREPTPSALT